MRKNLKHKLDIKKLKFNRQEEEESSGGLRINDNAVLWFNILVTIEVIGIFISTSTGRDGLAIILIILSSAGLILLGVKAVLKGMRNMVLEAGEIVDDKEWQGETCKDCQRLYDENGICMAVRNGVAKETDRACCNFCKK